MICGLLLDISNSASENKKKILQLSVFYINWPPSGDITFSTGRLWDGQDKTKFMNK